MNESILSILKDLGVGVLLMICLFALAVLANRLYNRVCLLYQELWYPRLKVYCGGKKIYATRFTKTNFLTLLRNLDNPQYYGVFKYNPEYSRLNYQFEMSGFPIFSLVNEQFFVTSVTNEVCMGFRYCDVYYFVYLKFVDYEGLIDELNCFKTIKEYFEFLCKLDDIGDNGSFSVNLHTSFDAAYHYNHLKDLQWYALKRESSGKVIVSRTDLPTSASSIFDQKTFCRLFSWGCLCTAWRVGKSYYDYEKSFSWV